MSDQTQQSQGGSGGQNDTVMAVLAYLGILVLIPILTGEYKKSSFVKHHTNQGVVFLIFCIAFSIVLSILMTILSSVLISNPDFLGLFTVISLVLSLLWFIPTILLILGIINAVKGETKPLPVIGNFTIVK